MIFNQLAKNFQAGEDPANSINKGNILRFRVENVAIKGSDRMGMLVS